jgi:hypothetical protein
VREAVDEAFAHLEPAAVSIDARLTRLSSALSARERAILVLGSLKDGQGSRRFRPCFAVGAGQSRKFRTPSPLDVPS